MDGVKGHAGYAQACTASKYYSNKNFLINLYKAFNKLHDTRGNCIISPLNFAVNDRPYDPSFKGSLLSYVPYSTI